MALHQQPCRTSRVTSRTPHAAPAGTTRSGEGRASTKIKRRTAGLDDGIPRAATLGDAPGPSVRAVSEATTSGVCLVRVDGAIRRTARHRDPRLPRRLRQRRLLWIPRPGRGGLGGARVLSSFGHDGVRPDVVSRNPLDRPSVARAQRAAVHSARPRRPTRVTQPRRASSTSRRSRRHRRRRTAPAPRELSAAAGLAALRRSTRRPGIFASACCGRPSTTTARRATCAPRCGGCAEPRWTGRHRQRHVGASRRGVGRRARGGRLGAAIITGAPASDDSVLVPCPRRHRAVARLNDDWAVLERERLRHRMLHAFELFEPPAVRVRAGPPTRCALPGCSSRQTRCGRAASVRW